MLQKTDTSSTAPGASTKDDLVKRRKLGIYYTPDTVAKLLVQWGIQSATDTVLEPSFGGCSLLSAAVEQLRRLGATNPLSQISGFDIDPQALKHLRNLVGTSKQRAHFVLADFLRSTPDRRFDAVIANPPFVSYHQCDLDQREILKKWRQSSSISIPGTSSLWVYFLLHAMSFLNRNGRLAFILPQAALTADYAAPVWSYVRTHFKQIAIVKLGGPVFAAAGANTRVIILLGRDYLQEGSAIRAEIESVAIEDVDDSACTTLLPGSSSLRISNSSHESAQTCIDTLRAQGLVGHLGRLVHARIGEVIGDRKFFVRSTKQWRHAGVPPALTKPLLIRSSALTGARLLPSDVSERSDFPRALVTDDLSNPAVESLIASYPKHKREGNVTFAKREPWYRVPYDSSAQAFFPSLSHRAPRIVLNHAGVSCSNVFYKLSPRPATQWLPVLAIASLTTPFQLSAELAARIRGVGGLKLEPKDVHQLVVPVGIEELAHKHVVEGVRAIDHYMRSGNHFAASRAADELLLTKSRILERRTLIELREYLEDLRSQRLSGVT